MDANGISTSAFLQALLVCYSIVAICTPHRLFMGKTECHVLPPTTHAITLTYSHPFSIWAVYKRNTKKLAALSRYLAETGRYKAHVTDPDALRVHWDSLGNVNEDANKGSTNSLQYYMTLLLTLPVNPVDIAGAMNAIKNAEYDISLFPDVEQALKDLKHSKGLKIAVVTDSMASTAEKKDWMQKAGLDTSLYVAIPRFPLPLDLQSRLEPNMSILTQDLM